MNSGRRRPLTLAPAGSEGLVSHGPRRVVRDGWSMLKTGEGPLASRERGAAAVEFAIIAVVLFMVLFGIFEFGRIFSQLEVFNSAARQGGRVASVRGSVAEIQAAIATAAEPYSVSGPVSITPGGDPPCTDANSGSQVRVEWQQNVQISIAILPPLNKNVTIQGTFRCE